MRKCSKGCIPSCDYCIFYAHNGEPHVGPDGSVLVVYVGRGKCRHPEHPGRREPQDYCDDFCCRLYEAPKGDRANWEDLVF